MKARLIPFVVFALLVVLFGVGIVWNEHHDASYVPSPLIGKSAPAFDLPRLEDPAQRVRKADLLGKPYLINVFASWCFACGDEHPVLMEYSSKFGVPLIGYDYKDKPADAKAWLIQHGNPYHQVLADRSGATAIDFGVYGAMKRTLLLLACVFALLTSVAAFAIDPLPFKDAAQRERFQHLTSQLRCMVCQNESLDASNADLAKDLRHQIFEMMQQGRSDEQIKQYLVARYSDFVLYDPPLKASTIALWFTPPTLVVVGGIVVFVLLRKRSKPAAQIAADETGVDW